MKQEGEVIRDGDDGLMIGKRADVAGERMHVQRGDGPGALRARAQKEAAMGGAGEEIFDVPVEAIKREGVEETKRADLGGLRGTTGELCNLATEGGSSDVRASRGRGRGKRGSAQAATEGTKAKQMMSEHIEGMEGHRVELFFRACEECPEEVIVFLCPEQSDVCHRERGGPQREGRQGVPVGESTGLVHRA